MSDNLLHVLMFKWKKEIFDIDLCVQRNIEDEVLQYQAKVSFCLSF